MRLPGIARPEVKLPSLEMRCYSGSKLLGDVNLQSRAHAAFRISFPSQGHHGTVNTESSHAIYTGPGVNLRGERYDR